MRRRAPFTLLEVIIATGIFLLASLTLYVYSRGVMDSWGRVLRERDHFSELMSLDRGIEAVLTNMVPFTWPDTDSVDKTETPFIVAGPHYLRCAYLHRMTDREEGALRFAEFVVEDGGLYLVYSDRPFLDWSQVGGRQQSSLLAQGVSEINFRYADWDDDDTTDWATRLFWTDEWETESSGRKDVPLAVLMEVVWEDGRVESWLRRTMGNGYRERFGKWEAVDDEL